jgi:hypothetical protein
VETDEASGRDKDDEEVRFVADEDNEVRTTVSHRSV